MRQGKIRLVAAMAGAALGLPATAAAVQLPGVPEVPDLGTTTALPAPGAQLPALPAVRTGDVGSAVREALAAGRKPRKLRRARPAWFTKRKERKVRRDGDGVYRAPVDAPLPGQVGIRPGSMLISPYICTTNFLFQKSGTLAIGTAGHCVDNRRPVLLTLAPSSANPVLVELGRVLLRRDAGIGKDYALIEVPRHLWSWAFPTIAGVGGPCGQYTGGAPQPVFHYGHGLVVGTGGTPRAGMGFSLANDPRIVRGVDWDWDEDSFVWAGLLAGGDSGSAVRAGALGAVGDLTHGLGVTGLEPSAVGWGTRVTTITSSGWQLVDSPLCP